MRFLKDEGAAQSVPRAAEATRTIRLDKATVAYLKGLADEVGMQYQNLINLYLRDCALNQKKLNLRRTS